MELINIFFGHLIYFTLCYHFISIEGYDTACGTGQSQQYGEKF